MTGGVHFFSVLLWGDAMGRWRELYRRFWIVRLLTAVGFLLLGAGGTALWRWWHG